MLPMGTIVTVCMLIGVFCLLVSILLKANSSLTKWLFRFFGAIVFLGGAWNTLWHGLRNLTNFWGIAALLSGMVMMIAAVVIVRHGRANSQWLPIIVLLLLSGFFVLYAVTIYRL